MHGSNIILTVIVDGNRQGITSYKVMAGNGVFATLKFQSSNVEVDLDFVPIFFQIA